jgi:hypothetical protein
MPKPAEKRQNEVIKKPNEPIMSLKGIVISTKVTSNDSNDLLTPYKRLKGVKGAI